jgi:DNA-binding LacI/PurR family transcriptional regulator
MKKSKRVIGRAPIYQDLAASILSTIESGHYEGKLPGKHDLAEQWKVSHPTVMKALRQLAAQGVLELRPGVRARILRSSSARRRIGVLLFGISEGPLHARLMGGMQHAAQERDYRLVFEHHHGDKDRALEIAQALAADPDLQGMIYWPSNSPSNKPDAPLRFLIERKIPTLLLPDIPNPGNLPVHNLYAAPDFALIADYLAQRGVTRIGLAETGIAHNIAAVRAKQFTSALKKFNLPPPTYIDLKMNGRFEAEEIPELPAQLRTLDAVCCLSDQALGYLTRICLAHGIRVPGDLILTGADNMPPNNFLLTPTLDRHFDRIGYRAIEILADRENRADRKPVREVFPSELVLPKTSIHTTSQGVVQ